LRSRETQQQGITPSRFRLLEFPASQKDLSRDSPSTHSRVKASSPFHICATFVQICGLLQHANLEICVCNASFLQLSKINRPIRLFRLRRLRSRRSAHSLWRRTRVK